LNAFSVTISTNYVSATAGTAITPVTITNTGDAAFYYSISPAISTILSKLFMCPKNPKIEPLIIQNLFADIFS
jgi:hypothetical protein